MKLKCLALSMSIVAGALWAHAQTTFELVASELIPHEDGFFRGGLNYDFNGDHLLDFVNGCPSAFDFEDYERRDPGNVTYDLHNESGTQLGFTYKNAMLFPVCDAKYASTLEPAISKGYIQLRPGIDTTAVDLANSYILSPQISNLRSITLEVSADVSVQDSRHIPWLIEYSADGGETYNFDVLIEDAIDQATDQGGFRVTYTAESDVAFADMQKASQKENIMLRLITITDEQSNGVNKGQYLKVHKFSIVADSAMITDPNKELALGDRILNKIKFKNGYLTAGDQPIKVHTISGRLIGEGLTVGVEKGLYIITTNDSRKKMLIQ